MREGRKWTRRALVDPRKGVGCWQCCRRGAFGLCELKGSSSWELHSLEGQQPAISFNFQGQQHGTQGPQEHFLRKCLCLCFRIAGDTALNKNIHESVSAQIRKNFAKSKWRVSPKCVCFVFAKSPGTLNHSGEGGSPVWACYVSIGPWRFEQESPESYLMNFAKFVFLKKKCMILFYVCGIWLHVCLCTHSCEPLCGC